MSHIPGNGRKIAASPQKAAGLLKALLTNDQRRDMHTTSFGPWAKLPLLYVSNVCHLVCLG